MQPNEPPTDARALDRAIAERLGYTVRIGQGAINTTGFMLYDTTGNAVSEWPARLAGGRLCLRATGKRSAVLRGRSAVLRRGVCGKIDVCDRRGILA